MSTDTDPRVAEAMRLHKISTRSHHVWQTLSALGEPDERAQAAVDDHTALMAYLAAEFAKVPSAPVVGRIVFSTDIRCAAIYNLNRRDDAFDAAKRWGACIQAITTMPGDPVPSAPVEEVPRQLSNERIDAIAEIVVKGMPDGIQGFLKSWGWRQFARAILEDCAGYAATTPPQAEPSPSMSKSWQTAVAVAREAPSGRAVVDSAVILAIDKRLSEAFAELQEVRKDAVIHRGGERPSDGWYWMRWHVDGPTPTPWALLNTFAGPMLETTEWAGPLKPPAAAMTKEKP